MTLRTTGTVLRHVRAVCAAEGSAALSDEQLLQRFVASREEPAFRALLLRHGPLVWGVCRRLLQDGDAAEDAFQTTFVTLARKAEAIRKQSSLGSWLYGVAFRVASRARAAACRLPASSTTLDAFPDSHDGQADITLREARAVLDQELGRLAEKNRAPLVLCYLEGKTRDEAAQQLGCPLSTFKHRLDDGRRLLRRALERRGVALAMVLTATALTTGRAPAALVDAAVRAALSGVAAPGAVLSTAGGFAGALLAHGGRWKMTAVLLLSAGFLCALVGPGDQSPPLAAAEQAPAAAEKAVGGAAPTPTPKAPAADLFGDPLPPEALARMGTIRWRHLGLSFIAVLPGDQGVVTTGRDGVIRLWDGATGKERRRFEKPADDPGLTAKLPSDDAARARLETMMRRMIGGEVIQRGATEPAVSADGKVLAQLRDDGRVFLWDVATAKSRRTIVLPEAAGSARLVLNRDGSRLAVQTAKGQALVLDAATGKELQRLGEDKYREKGVPVNELGQFAFSADGKRLLTIGIETAAKDRSGRFLGKSFDLATGKEFEPFEGPGKAAAFALLSPDGSKLAWTTNVKGRAEMHVVDTATGKDVCQIEEKSARNSTPQLVFSADGAKLAGYQQDGSLVVWDLTNGKRLAGYGAALPYSGGAMWPVAFSDDGQTLFLTSMDGNAIRRWDLAKERPEANAAGHLAQVNALAVAADGKAVITLGQDNTLRRWSPDTGKEIDCFPIPAGTTALTFSPDGKRCAFSSGNAAMMRDVASTEKPIRLEGEAAVAEFAFSPDGKSLFGLSAPAALYVWEAETGKLLRRIRLNDTAPETPVQKGLIFLANAGTNPSRMLAVAADGRTLALLPNRRGGLAVRALQGAAAPASEEDRTIALWDTVRGKRIGQIEAPKSGAVTLAFSPDGRLLAVVGSDQSITLWEVASGQVRQRIQGEEADGNPAVLAFSPDGRTLALAYPDRSIRFRDVDSGKLLGPLSGHQGRINALAYAADGQTLFSASSDTTALAWSLKSIVKPETPPRAELTADAVAAAWAALAEPDAGKALQAIRTLAGSAHMAPILAERVKPTAPADPVLLTRLLTDLEDADFAKREQAEEGLVQIGELAVTALEKVLAGTPGLESRQRIEHILEVIATTEQPRPEVLRTLRAIEVLERLGSPAARQALEKLSRGEAAARQTKAARAALGRLSASTSARAD